MELFIEATEMMNGQPVRERRVRNMLDQVDAQDEAKNFLTRAGEYYEAAMNPPEDMDEDYCKIINLRTAVIFYLISTIQDTTKCAEIYKQVDIDNFYVQWQRMSVDTQKLLERALKFSKLTERDINVRKFKEADRVWSEICKAEEVLCLDMDWPVLFEEVFADAKAIRDKIK